MAISSNLDQASLAHPGLTDGCNMSCRLRNNFCSPIRCSRYGARATHFRSTTTEALPREGPDGVAGAIAAQLQSAHVDVAPVDVICEPHVGDGVRTASS